jgi:DnaJ homolog subfamily B member 6
MFSQLAGLGGSPFGGLLNAGMGGSGNVRSYSSMSQSIGSNGQWVTSSKMTRTINGRTETITTKRDAQGNEHITYSSPEGERYTINGIEQAVPNDHYLPSSGRNPPPPTAASNYDPGSSSSRNVPPPPLPPPQQPYIPTTQPAMTAAYPIGRHHSQHEGMYVISAADNQVSQLLFIAHHLRHHDDGVRRSSSSRHYYRDDRDPRYDAGDLRRSSSSLHHRSSRDHSSYADPRLQDRGAKYHVNTAAYADRHANVSPHRRHHQHQDRYAVDGRHDEHSRRRWFGW